MVGEMLSDLKQADKAKKDREKAEQVKVDAERKAKTSAVRIWSRTSSQRTGHPKKKDEASKQRDAEVRPWLANLSPT